MRVFKSAGLYNDPNHDKKYYFRKKLEAFLEEEGYILSITKDSGANYYTDKNNNMIVFDTHKYYYFNSDRGMILQEGDYLDNYEEFIRDYRLNNLLDGK